MRKNATREAARYAGEGVRSFFSSIKSFFAAFGALLLLAVIVAVILYAKGVFNPGSKGLINIEKEVKVTDIQIKAALEDVAQLSTQERTFTDIYVYDEEGLTDLDRKLWIFSYSGSIQAGIRNMDDMDCRIYEDHEMVVVTYPAIEVFPPNIDQSSVETVYMYEGWLNRFDEDDAFDFLEECEDRQLEIAEDDEAFTQSAEDNLRELTTTLVEELLQGTEYEDYEIRVFIGNVPDLEQYGIDEDKRDEEQNASNEDNSGFAFLPK